MNRKISAEGKLIFLLLQLQVCILKKSFIYPFYCTLTSSFPLHSISTSLPTTGGIHTYNHAHKVYSKAHTREKCIEAICVTLYFNVHSPLHETKKNSREIFLSRNLVWKWWEGGEEKNRLKFPFHAFHLHLPSFLGLRVLLQAWNNEKIMRMESGDDGAMYIKLWIRNFPRNIKYVKYPVRIISTLRILIFWAEFLKAFKKGI